MKYTIKLTDVNDPHHLPWDIVVEDSKYDNVLTVQEPSPYAGSNLFGFETEPQACELFVRLEERWPIKAIGMHPVLVERGGMYSLRGFKVRSVIDNG